VQGLVDAELPVVMYGSPTAAAAAAAGEDHTAGLQAECRLVDTWAERSQKVLSRPSCPSSPP
jgi:hypothetical protein